MSIDEFIKLEIEPILLKLDELRDKNLKLGKKNKRKSSVALIPALVWAYIYLLGIIRSFLITTLIFLIPLSLVLLVYSLVKPHAFLSKRKKYSFKNIFKNRIIGRTVAYIDSNLTYRPTFRTHFDTLEKSNLLSIITEHKEDDGIIGDIGNCRVRISELHTMNNLKCTFDGIFVRVIFNDAIDINCNNQNLDLIIKDNEAYIKSVVKHKEILDLIYDFRNYCTEAVKFSFSRKTIYIAIENKSNLFEISNTRSNNDDIISNIKLLDLIYKMITSLIYFYNKT